MIRKVLLMIALLWATLALATVLSFATGVSQPLPLLLVLAALGIGRGVWQVRRGRA